MEGLAREEGSVGVKTRGTPQNLVSATSLDNAFAPVPLELVALPKREDWPEKESLEWSLGTSRFLWVPKRDRPRINWPPAKNEIKGPYGRKITQYKECQQIIHLFSLFLILFHTA